MKNSFYFPHDNNARNDDRLLMLRSKFGNFEGYALYFWFLESMASTADGYLIRGAIGGLSISYGVPIERLDEFVKYCLEIGLFKENGNTIYSERMCENLLKRMAMSDGGRKGANRLWGSHKPPYSPPIRPPNARRGEEKRGKDIKPPNPQRGIEVFDAFWNIYPKKVGKGAAEKAWSKINGTDPARIMAAVEAQKKSDQWQKDGGQFIPHPTTWLNQRRWEDEIQKSEDEIIREKVRQNNERTRAILSGSGKAN